MKNAVLDRIPGVLRKGPALSKRVALTFDDGPDELTPKYLDVLDELGAPATFFVCGERAVQYPEYVREYLRRGHQVANHGFDHTSFNKMSRKALLEQLDRTEESIGGQVTGRLWVRPPHGTVDPASLVTLYSRGYVVALWSVDSRDYSESDAPTLAARCGPNAIGPGDVVLFHEGHPWTLAALPEIISNLQGSGLELVTMHDLFAR